MARKSPISKPPTPANKFDEIRIVTETGNAPTERCATPEAAYTLYRDLRDATYYIAALDAKVQGMYDGNPPYTQESLNSIGQGWRANLNTREVKAAINSKAEAAYELHMESPTRIEVAVRPEIIGKYARSTDVPVENWGQIIAEEYTKTLFDWKEGYFNVDLATRESLKYGLGLMTWPDEWDWRPKAFKKSCFLVHPRSRALADELDMFGLRDEVTAGQLYEKIRDPAAAREAGWDVAAVKDLLVRIFISGEQQDFPRDTAGVDLWRVLQERIKMNEPDVQVKAFEKVRIVHLCVAETDTGEVSHIIIPETQTAGEPKFLFKRARRFKKMCYALWLLPHGYEDGYIGSLRGLGHELYTYGEVSNRLLCSALDGGIISGGLLLQASNGFDADQLSVLRAGPVTVIPPNLEAVQNTFTPPIAGLIDLRNVLRTIADNNVGVFRVRPEMLGGEQESQKTARQVVSEEGKEAKYDKNRANFEYLMWQRWHEEIFRRLTNPEYLNNEIDLPGKDEAKAFRTRCLDRGVPKELLKDTEKSLDIRISRVIGLGSPGARMDITSQMMAVTGRMDETGRRYAEREWAAARVQYANVDKFFPLRNRDQVPTNEVTIATLENNDFLEGRSLPVGSDQLHAIHIDQAHEPMIINMIKAFTEAPETSDLQAVYRTLQAAIPHYHAHVQALGRDPSRREYVVSKVSVLKELIRFFQSLESQMAKLVKEQEKLAQERKAAEIAAIQKSVSEESQARLREIEVKADLERMKQASLNNMRAEKTAVQNDINVMKAQQQTSLDRMMAESKIGLDTMLAQAKMDLMKIKPSGG